jgi:photosystem II stability/assembly factor-like uncharacterized protein
LKTRLVLTLLGLWAFFGAPSSAQWQQVTSYTSEQYLAQVYGVDSLYAWTVAWTKPAIQRSTNGGVTWDSLPAPAGTSNNNFNSVYFYNRQLGWIVTTGAYSNDAGKFFRTTDGGQTWQQVINPVVGIAQWITFLDSLNGWACGATDQLYYYGDTSGTEAGLVWRTTDGGVTWAYQRFTKPISAFTMMQILPNGFGVLV